MNGSRLEELPDVLTVEETCRVLRLGRNSVYEGIRRKEIPSVKIGRRVLVPKAGIARLLSAGEDEGLVVLPGGRR